jgi:DNA (cytosine-5)-methyltransferase 1
MNARHESLHDYAPELVVDLFAGGGGASTGIEQAIGRQVDIAVNHNAKAIALHQANHPNTLHFVADVFEVDPLRVTCGQPVGLLWASPDCKHFSKAKGGKPVSKKIRGLAWVVVDWARAVRPRVICLENVEEFKTWGPLTEDDMPDPARKGETFAEWKGQLEALGYVVEHRELRACDYGAPTIRKRLFLVARCDGEPIFWPSATHGGSLKPYRTAADCIDWSIPCPSIFERERELAPATMRRIARGIKRYVLDAARPFIVPIQNYGWGDRCNSIDEPLRTVTANPKGGAFALASPTLVQTHALVAAFLAKHYGGNETPGIAVGGPISTVTTQDHHHLVACNLAKLRGTSNSADIATPLHTVSAQGEHHALVESRVTDGSGNEYPSRSHHAEVRALLLKYYGTDQDPQLGEPLHTVTTKDRFGLVTVKGEDYFIADIGMRMLQPRELYRAQGFPDSYIIDRGADGKPLSKADQVRMCGNSVCPPLARAIVAANYVDVTLRAAA